MRNVEGDPKLFGLVDPHVHRDIRRTLETMMDQLDRCQKALSDFLEDKRSGFPRFYFIGDDDLLEILGQAKNPAVIQSHLKKLFQGVSRVVFDDAKTTITAMISSSGEIVQLENGIKTLNPGLRTHTFESRKMGREATRFRRIDKRVCCPERSYID